MRVGSLSCRWWSVFWVLFTAKSNGAGPEDALLYTQVSLGAVWLVAAALVLHSLRCCLCYPNVCSGLDRGRSTLSTLVSDIHCSFTALTFSIPLIVQLAISAPSTFASCRAESTDATWPTGASASRTLPERRTTTTKLCWRSPKRRRSRPRSAVCPYAKRHPEHSPFPR